MVRCVVVAFAMFAQISVMFAQESTKQGAMPSAEKIAKSRITFDVIVAEGGGYGYDIFTDGKKLIHQATIPGQAGTKGFKTKSDSRKVAELVIRKLKNKDIPPAITEDELRRLKVID